MVRILIMKEKIVPSWKDFNILLEKVSIKDKIGHLFVADVFFVLKKTSETNCCSTNYIRLYLRKKTC